MAARKLSRWLLGRSSLGLGLGLLLALGSGNARAQREAPARATDQVWALGSLSLGGGSGHLGAIYGAAAAEAHLWLPGDMGLGARYAGFGAGEPDGGGSEGRAIVGLVSWRLALGAMTYRAHPDDGGGLVRVGHTDRWIVGTLGVGSVRSSGYTGRVRGDGDFAFHTVVIAPRVAMMSAWRFLVGGGALEASVVPGQGTSVSLSVLAGAAF